MAGYQPLFVDFTGKKVVIFGGGAVGERKAAYFAGADVTVVSREFTPGLQAMPGIRPVVTDVTARTVPGLIEGAFLVVAATGDSALNSEIARIAGNKGILVNAAEGGSDVILPSKIVQGDIMLAISTGGHSPAMARYLRQRLEESLGKELSDMVRLQSELREELKKNVPSQDERERLLWLVLGDRAIWETLKTSFNDAKLLAIEKLEKEK
ncbi:MAG TPA: bifunctional precorrin-2 dehydrogenase/sirohydrochlorin ferrochelatase [Methanocella sp.]|jgi:precorrin-2 dehydrogenase/sirohydrochlorin ferrochelatase